MKQRTIASLGLAVLAGISPVTPAFAVVNIGWVTVGDVNNPKDPATSNLYGSVDHPYNIAQNDTTVSQYCEFLNAAAKSDPYTLYNPWMADDTIIAGISRSGSSGSYSYVVVAGSGNKPITYVSWFDAARFCNWMHNGQGSGSTETGAYTLNGAMAGIILKNSNAAVWIPTENEWYKAAYYDPTKGGTNYWACPTQSDTLAGNKIGVAHSANYYDNGFVGYPGMVLTDVGAYGANSASHYGTNDQGGNVWQWNDAVIGSSRGLRGGSWHCNLYDLSSSGRSNSGPSVEGNGTGFRVAAIPEPGSMVLALLACGMLVTRRKR
ncbi:MAG: SUMF1/EgtB/PvdO family nonheme iron enzyme [Verrucomicrobia bacterium]|nr:SUMF1/EgtB/PvdO family nonheme iron enzyme [Verrucomicrobiota bacterium]